MTPIHLIRTKTDHRAALKRIGVLWDASAKSPEADELELLSLLVEAYEKEHITMPKVDPVSLLRHAMGARGLTRKDVEPFIGTRARVAEVVNRVQPL